MNEEMNTVMEATEAVAEAAVEPAAKAGILDSDAGKFGLGVVVGSVAATAGRKACSVIFGKLRKKRAEKKAAKAKPDKVDQICQEIEDSLKEK